MPWHEIVPGHATMVRLTAPAPPSVPVPSRIPRPHAGADHPWRQRYATMRTGNHLWQLLRE
jgi:hypothetical protein